MNVRIRALAVGATSIAKANNHPTVDVSVSQEDRVVLQRFLMMESPLLDFLIVGDNTYLSAREEYLL